MRATARPSVSQPAAPPTASSRQAPVRWVNRIPLAITAGLAIGVTAAAVSVAIDRANRRTVEPRKASDAQSSQAIAHNLTTGRPDGIIGARPASPRQAADPAQHAVGAQGGVQPGISGQAAAQHTQSDAMEELRKRMALQRAERLEQEHQRQELAMIQGHDEALRSPTLIDMARGSYARTADRVRNGQVPGSPLVRGGVVPSAPAVRTAWASSSGDAVSRATSSGLPDIGSLAGSGGEITRLPTAEGGSGAGSYGGGSYSSGFGAGSFSPAHLNALQPSQAAQDPNEQASKLSFLNQPTDTQGYLAHFVQQPLSPYELKKGSVIPATMITGVNSDLPGRMIAQVNQNVFDSATGRYLLIPQGSRLFGRYDAGVTYGQERVLVVWTDVTFPDGSTLHLGGMAGSDQAGYGGFADRIDNHELRTYGSAILLSLVGAASEYAIATARNPGVGGVSITLQQAGVENVSSTFGNVVRQSFQKNINVQPTIEVRPGYRFNVIVEKDIVFPPYGP